MAHPISIEMFPAGNGDAILIDFGEQLFLIDAGYTSTFRNHIKPRLQALHEAGRKLTKLVVTHIDADHISGAIAFIKENGPAENPSIIAIEEVWFNSYRHLSFQDKEVGGFSTIKPDLPIHGGLESAETEHEEQLVSYNQGTSLGHQILKNAYPWNTTFNEMAVKTDCPITISMADGLKITLLGPTPSALDTMAAKWRKHLEKIFPGRINEDAYFDDAFEKMMEEMRQEELQFSEYQEEALVSSFEDWVEKNALEWEHEDHSPTNGSSIIFLMEHYGKKLLFLADAHPTAIIDQLKKIIPENQFPLKVDVLKVAHHGAWFNNNPELLQIVQADQYLFSSNGKRHHHPHFETMAWILKQHPQPQKTFVFNYRQNERLVVLDTPRLQQKYNYKVLWPNVDIWGNGLDGYIKIMLP